MPIGNIDYVSAAPWNDPMNPWPQYSQIALSGMIVDDDSNPVYVNNLVLDMTWFDPSVEPGNEMCIYEDIDNAWYLKCYINVDNGDAMYQIATNAGAGLFYNRVNSASRAIPAKNVVGAGTAAAQGWDNSYGVSMDGLLILPVTTALTPWEHRRRRTLEYI